LALQVDWPSGVISVLQADLTFVSGTLYEHDTDAFRVELIALEDNEDGIVWPRTHNHATQVAVAGTTFARIIEIISPYSITYENTGSDYSVRLAGSNNNLFDVNNLILNSTPGVTIIGQNSAGLVVTDTSGLTVAESAALLLIDTNVDTLLTAQTLTNDQAVAERTTNPHTGKLILRNITKMLRWEADAWEDDDMTIPYKGTGLESVGELVAVAWS